MLEIGSLVDGKYKILNEIGHGGMSVVYLAIVERANQTWAIKEVRKNGETKTDIVQQGLVTEMNILKRLNHPHLPRIIDIIDHDDSFLIVMDYIEGIDLDKKLREGPQKWEDVVEWSKQLCDVFAYLHSRKPPIIYRDMKPGNVKLKPDGNVVLFDFGTAREYKSQKAGDDTTCLGTRGYAAPEQYGGMGQTDARSDIYCLGATMYHLVTGQLPGGPPEYIIPPIRAVCPWLPRTGKAGNCVRGLEQIIMKCVQPNPANRYQNCAELMYDLEHIDKISEDFIRLQKKRVRTWMTTAICAGVFAVAGVALGFAADNTISNGYNGQIEAAFSNNIEAGQIKSDRVARESLEKAIAVNPSDPDAWLYLARLYASDYVISGEEFSAMADLVNRYPALKNNKSAYARFSYEWALDLFFFNSKLSDAELYLHNVIGNSATEVTAEDREGCIKALQNPVPGSYTECPPEYIISTVSRDVAEQQFNLAKALYPIATRSDKVAETQGFKKAYSVSSYIDDVKTAVGHLDTMNEDSLPIDKSIIKTVFCWRTLIKLNEIITTNQDSEEVNVAAKQADEIYNLVNGITSPNEKVNEYKSNAEGIYRNIKAALNAEG